MPIIISDLETRRFGVTCARFDGMADGFPDLADVNAAAREQGVSMMSTRIDVTALDRVHALEIDGYRLMDTLVYYSRSLKRQKLTRPLREGLALCLSRPDDASQVAQIAQAAFSGYSGHYHSDPRLENTAADAAYVEWAESSIASLSADSPCLLVTDNQTVVGFLTLRCNDTEEMEIVLNAVHPSRQHEGLYTALVAEALSLGNRMGRQRMIVSTQINNYAVQRIWSRLGFVHTRSLYTFHKWFD